MNILKLFALFLALVSLSAKAAEPALDKSLFERVNQTLTDRGPELYFVYYSQEARVKLVEDFLDQVRLQYAGLLIKQKRFGFNLEDLKKEAIETEQSVPIYEDRIDQAKANLDFLDRMRALIAKFHDTHFKFNPVNELSSVFLPFTVANINERYFIVEIRPNVLKYLSTWHDEFLNINIGDELVEFNGQNPKVEIEKLKNYFGKSSEHATEAKATEALTIRDSVMPDSAIAKFTIRQKDKTTKFSMRWFFSNAKRLDQYIYLTAKNFQHLSPIVQSIDAFGGDPNLEFAKLVSKKTEELIPSNATLIESYLDENEQPMITGATLESGGQKYTILKIHSFYPEPEGSTKVHLQKQAKIEFSDALRKIITNAKSNNTPIILDLRSNGGGYPDLATATLSMLLAKDSIIPGPTRAYRVSSLSSSMLYNYRNSTPNVQAIDAIDINREIFISEIIEDYESSRNLGKEYSSSHQEPILNDSNIDGLNLPLIGLIGPDCVSACDILAYLLKANNFKLLGTSTNGTGLGTTDSKFSAITWTDRYRILSTVIPNHMFGKPSDQIGPALIPDSAEELNLENKPTVADVYHEPTLNDYINNSEDIFNLAISELNRMEKK